MTSTDRSSTGMTPTAEAEPVEEQGLGPSNESKPKSAGGGADRRSGARFVAVGIFSSKIFGLVREMFYARYLGIGPHTDVLRQAFRTPNLLQNLLGEQTLSAAFIPIYSRMLEEGREKDAGRFAGAVFGLLVAAVSVLVLIGVVFAPWIVAVLSPGFLADAAKVAAGEMAVDRYPLLVSVVRLIFPMTGFMVLAAWTMGILNSHRRFFLPYMAPAFWNMAILSGLFWVAFRQQRLLSPAGASLDELTAMLYGICTGAMVGGLLQFLVQVPLVWRLTRGRLRFSLFKKVKGVSEALVAVGPALAGRGVVQLSLYIDTILASLLAAGAPAAIAFAGPLNNLPLGVFGMSVAAAELPELSRKDPSTARRAIAERIRKAASQSAFLVVPSVLGYLVFGFLVVGLLYRGGEFQIASNWLVWAVLACYTFGLLPSTLSRLMQNSFFALRDTKSPAKIATVRLAASAIVGLGLMVWLDQFSVTEMTGAPGGERLFFGACGLAIASSLGAWCELALLVRSLGRKLPELTLPFARLALFVGLAIVACGPAAALWWWLRESSLLVQGCVVLGAYAGGYLGVAAVLGMPELELWAGRLRRKRSKTVKGNAEGPQ